MDKEKEYDSSLNEYIVISEPDERYNEILKDELHEVKNLIKNEKCFIFLEKNLKIGGNKTFYKNLVFEIRKTRKFYNSKKQFVMVGCGYLPLTMLVYCNSYPKSKFIGIDIDEKAIKSCNELRKVYDLGDNTFFKIIDGKKYNYINSKTILIAAMVKNKIAVLDRILSTVSVGSKIFIRLFYDEDYEIINKLSKSDIGLKVLYKINKDDYPIKEEYDLVILEKSKNQKILSN